MEYYRSHTSVYMRRNSGQDNTDLEKCIDFVSAEFRAARQQQRHRASPSTAPAATIDQDVPANAVPSISHPPSSSSPDVDEWNLSALSAHRSNLIPVLVAATAATSVPVLVYPAFGGRFDQQMAQVHIAFKYEMQQDEIRLAELASSASSPTQHTVVHTPPHPLLLLAEGDSVRVLLPGRVHHLRTHPCLERAGHHCGLCPLASDAKAVSTTGLQWNLAISRWNGRGRSVRVMSSVRMRRSLMHPLMHVVR
jgi:thiamine pyrophosphokinase